MPEVKMNSETSNREFTARDITPILALIAFVVVSLYGKWPRLSWILVGVAVLFGVLDHYAALKRGVQRWKGLRDDRKTARRSSPEFQALVARFGAFVNRQTNDTLHYIVESDIYRGRNDFRTACQLPNVDIWAVFWRHFSERINHRLLSMTEFKPALTEFHYLVASYNNFCVAPIFELFPANLRPQIEPDVVRKLNLFQQKFRRYLEDYQLFAESLSKSRPILKEIPTNFAMPKPMN